MPENLSPETFDFDEWFADAHLPEESADIYTRADVLGRISELSRLIEVADDTDDGERTISQKSPSAQLREEYEQLAGKFQDSKITVYVRALLGTERKTIRDAHDATETEKSPKEGDEEFMYRLLSACIVGMARPGKDYPNGKYEPTSLTIEQVRTMCQKIGDRQVAVLRDAHLEATHNIPEVSADFLPGASLKADTSEL